MSESGSSFLKLGESQRDMMHKLRGESGPFKDGLAACRLAVVLSIKSDFAELPLEGAQNVYNAGTFDDADGTISISVMELSGVADSEVWAKLSRMANWGIVRLHEAMRDGDISFRRLLTDPEA